MPKFGGGGGGLGRWGAGVVVVFPLSRWAGYFALHGCCGVGLGVGEAVEERGGRGPRPRAAPGGVGGRVAGYWR